MGMSEIQGRMLSCKPDGNGQVRAVIGREQDGQPDGRVGVVAGGAAAAALRGTRRGRWVRVAGPISEVDWDGRVVRAIDARAVELWSAGPVGDPVWRCLVADGVACAFGPDGGTGRW